MNGVITRFAGKLRLEINRIGDCVKKPIKRILITLLTLFILLNLIAFMHAYKMTHFTSSGPKPLKPEQLSFTQKATALFTGVTVPKPESKSIKPSFKYEVLNFPGFKGIPLECWLANGSKKDTILLLFHGYTESKTQLIPEAVKFLSRGYGVMLVDFYGSGGSGGNSTGVGYHEAVDVKAAYDKAVELGYKNIIIYAVSMGSAASMRAISAYGIKPSCLIIESPFAGLLDTVRRRFDLLKAPSWPFAEILVFWGSVIEGYNAFNYNPWQYAKDIRIPTLLLQGGKDKRVSVSQGEKIYENLAGEKKMVVFPDAGHLSYMKDDEKTWDREVFGWVEGR